MEGGGGRPGGRRGSFPSNSVAEGSRPASRWTVVGVGVVAARHGKSSKSGATQRWHRPAATKTLREKRKRWTLDSNPAVEYTSRIHSTSAPARVTCGGEHCPADALFRNVLHDVPVTSERRAGVFVGGWIECQRGSRGSTGPREHPHSKRRQRQQPPFLRRRARARRRDDATTRKARAISPRRRMGLVRVSG